MQVLYQEWMSVGQGLECSISKDALQLQQTIAKLKASGTATPKGEAYMVEIWDTSGFVDMVRVDTVFLEEEECRTLGFPKK